MRSVGDIIKMQFAGEYEILWGCPSCMLYQILNCDISAILNNEIECEDCFETSDWNKIHIESIEVY